MSFARDVESAGASALGVTIREARPDDGAGIARVQVDTSRQTYHGLVPRDLLHRVSFSAQFRCWQRRLRNADPDFIVHVAESSAGEILGFAAAGRPRAPVEDYNTELFAIYVLPPNQGYGVGARLFRSVVSTATRAGRMSLIAWVIAPNPCRRFFEALAGRPVAMEIDRGEGVVRKVAYGWHGLTVKTFDTRYWRCYSGSGSSDGASSKVKRC